mmetsp:Transcript_14601/g.31640  ORF Transcript_14601/g.31640 Transcript_14601/m.31640 type:complete len:214 (-) Transcript_14601:19-660(-)
MDRARLLPRSTADVPAGAPKHACVVVRAAWGGFHHVIPGALAELVISSARRLVDALRVVRIHHFALGVGIAAVHRRESSTSTLGIRVRASLRWRRWRGRHHRFRGVRACPVPLVDVDTGVSSIAARRILHDRIALAPALLLCSSTGWLRHALGVVLVHRLAVIRRIHSRVAACYTALALLVGQSARKPLGIGKRNRCQEGDREHHGFVERVVD